MLMLLRWLIHFLHWRISYCEPFHGVYKRWLMPRYQISRCGVVVSVLAAKSHKTIWDCVKFVKLLRLYAKIPKQYALSSHKCHKCLSAFSHFCNEYISKFKKCHHSSLSRRMYSYQRPHPEILIRTPPNCSSLWYCLRYNAHLHLWRREN